MSMRYDAMTRLLLKEKAEKKPENIRLERSIDVNRGRTECFSRSDCIYIQLYLAGRYASQE